MAHRRKYGQPELIVANGAGNTVSVLLGNGDGSFQAQSTFATGVSARDEIAADVNGDSKSDVIVLSQSGVSVLLSALFT